MEDAEQFVANPKITDEPKPKVSELDNLVQPAGVDNEERDEDVGSPLTEQQQNFLMLCAKLAPNHPIPPEYQQDPSLLDLVKAKYEKKMVDISKRNRTNPNADEIYSQAMEMAIEDALHEYELENKSRVDILTGALNRAGFNIAVNEIARDEQATLGVIDLDQFKSINDTFGHKAGDVVLKVVASRMKNGLRGTDIFGRMGGDEFAIVLRNLPNAKRSQEILRRLQVAVEQPVAFHYRNDETGEEKDVSLSVGMSIAAVNLHDYPNPTDAFDACDQKMFVLKAQRHQAMDKVLQAEKTDKIAA